MIPEKFKDAVLDSLRQAVVKMTDPEWELSLEQNPGRQAEAKKVLYETQKTRLELENAQLSKIAKALSENEKALTEGKLSLDNALTDLKNVQNVIDNTTAFLKIIVRIL